MNDTDRLVAVATGLSLPRLISFPSFLAVLGITGAILLMNYRQAFPQTWEDQLDTLISQGHYQEALQQIDLQLEKYPNCYDAYFLQVDVYTAQNRTQEARQSLNKALEIQENPFIAADYCRY